MINIGGGGAEADLRSRTNYDPNTLAIVNLLTHQTEAKHEFLFKKPQPQFSKQKLLKLSYCCIRCEKIVIIIHLNWLHFGGVLLRLDFIEITYN
jgi:hydroxymethylpyrimidine/phosphomethylpyrimidine kinase